MTTITCSYKDNQILINENKNNIKNSFYYFDIKPIKFRNYNTETNFIHSQKILRFLDCVKDLTKKNPLLNIFDTPEIINEPFSTLKNMWLNLENQVCELNKDKIKKTCWLKKIDDLNNPQPYDIDYIFFESGLDPMYFIKHTAGNYGDKPNPNPNNSRPIYVRNVANEIIDPFTRAIHKQRRNEIFGENMDIIMDKSFFNFFGFNNTVLDYRYKYEKKSNKNNYNYKITFQFGNNEVFLDNKTNQEFIEGNNVKEDFLDSNAKEHDKKAFVVTKELGDVSQVMLMYIWSKYKNKHPSQYTMVTVDHIVFLLCQLLEEPCHLFNNKNKKKNDKDDDDNTKLKDIEYFLPIKMTPEIKTQKLKNAFEEKKKEIIDANNYQKTKLQTLIKLGFFEQGEQKKQMNKKNFQLIQFLIAKIDKIKDLLENETLENDITDEKIVNETEELYNKYTVGTIFLKNSNTKIMTNTKVGDKTFNYSDEMNRLFSNEERDIILKFKFDLKDSDIENKSMKTPTLPVLVTPPVVSPPQENSHFLDKISFFLYTQIQKYSNSLFEIISNNLYWSPLSHSNVMNGGRKIRKNGRKTRKIKNSIGGTGTAFFYSPLTTKFKTEFQEKIRSSYPYRNIYEDFISSQYGYEILDEFFKLNILEQIHKLSETHKKPLKNFINIQIGLGVIPSTRTETTNYVKNFFEELYTHFSFEFNRRGEVLYDDILLQEIIKYCDLKNTMSNNTKILTPTSILIPGEQSITKKRKLSNSKSGHIHNLFFDFDNDFKNKKRGFPQQIK